MPYYKEDQSIPTVAEALNREVVEDLKKLAALLPVSEKPTRKAELIALIVRHLEGENLRALWSQLDELQKAAVSEAVHSLDGCFHADRFRAKYGREPNWGHRDKWGYKKEPSLLGLFIYHARVPDDLRKRLKEFVPAPTLATLKVADEVPEFFDWQDESFDFKTRKREVSVKKIPLVQREMERSAPHDLQTVLRLIESGKVSVSDKTLHPTSAAMDEIALLLRGGDYYYQPTAQPKRKNKYEQEIGPIKAFAWPLLIQAARLTELSGKRLSLTKAGRKALSAPPAETLRMIWQRWLKTKIIDELRRVEVIKGQTGKGHRGLTSVEERRAVIAEALKQCPVGSWVTVDEFFRYMRAAGFDFEVTRDPWQLYVEELQYGSLGYEGFGKWSILQGRYALCFLFEYAATLGIIDTAYVSPVGAREDYTDLWGVDDLDFFSRYDGLLYFRLTPLGAYCFGTTTEAYKPTPLASRFSLSVLPSLKITATGEPLSPDEILLLDTYTERATDGVWHLNQAKTIEALEQGYKVTELREFLQARDEQPLPETIERFLVDMEERARRLRDRGTARLIECADAALIELIANDEKTKRYCLRAGERFLVVPAESETQFRKALRLLGYGIPKL